MSSLAPLWGIEGVSIPRGTLAAWGARAVAKPGAWELRQGQQDMRGPRAAREALARAVNSGALREAEHTERSAYINRTYPTGVVVCVVDRPGLLIYTQTIGRYVHVLALLTKRGSRR